MEMDQKIEIVKEKKYRVKKLKPFVHKIWQQPREELKPVYAKPKKQSRAVSVQNRVPTVESRHQYSSIPSNFSPFEFE